MMQKRSGRMRRLVRGRAAARAGRAARQGLGSDISLADLMMLDGSSALLEEWDGAGPRAPRRAPRRRLGRR